MTSLYFTSHPSPNDRLSRFSSDKQELYSLLATLEKTFDDIQFGKNLDLAKSNLEKALSKFPGNTHLENLMQFVFIKFGCQPQAMKI